MPQVPLFPAFITLAAAAIATVMDLWKFKVYNALTVPLLLSGLAYHGLAYGPGAFLASLMGVLFGFAVLIVFYAMGGMGAGDVKLMAAIGAWLGLPLTFYVFVASAFASATYAVVLVLLAGSMRETWVDLQVLFLRVMALGHHLGAETRLEADSYRRHRRRLVPFGAMVAVGLAIILSICLNY